MTTRARLASASLVPDDVDDVAGTVGGLVIQVPVADSTNAMLVDLGRHGAVDGTVLIADHQCGGRGKGERHWFSLPGDSLCVSVLLRPRGLDADLGQLTLVAAVAAHDAFLRLGVKTAIKWPNDILVGDRKVCGILAECHPTLDGRVEFVVVGFGINVSIAPEGFPPELQHVATSLQAAADRPLGRDVVLTACLAAFGDWVKRWQELGFAPVAEAWCRHSSTLGRHVDVLDGNERRHGLAIALAADGSLVLRDDAGRDFHIHSGDIRMDAVAAPSSDANRRALPEGGTNESRTSMEHAGARHGAAYGGGVTLHRGRQAGPD